MPVSCWRQPSVESSAISTPIIASWSGSNALVVRLYSAGTTSRFVRSPAAPKITMAQGPAFAVCTFGSMTRPLAVVSLGIARLSLVAVPRNLFAGRLHHMVRGEAEFLQQALERGRSAERVHSDHGAVPADIAVPADRRRLLDGDPGPNGIRQHCLAIGLVLLLEEL